MTFPRRGEIYLVEFDPARGHEIQKTRPALIIQNDVGNRYGALTIVAAITSTIPTTPLPVDVRVAPTKTNGLSVESVIKLGQIRSVDQRRLLKRIGRVDPTTMRQIDGAIKISLGLVAL